MPAEPRQLQRSTRPVRGTCAKGKGHAQLPILQILQGLQPTAFGLLPRTPSAPLHLKVYALRVEVLRVAGSARDGVPGLAALLGLIAVEVDDEFTDPLTEGFGLLFQGFEILL